MNTKQIHTAQKLVEQSLSIVQAQQSFLRGIEILMASTVKTFKNVSPNSDPDQDLFVNYCDGNTFQFTAVCPEPGAVDALWHNIYLEKNRVPSLSKDATVKFELSKDKKTLMVYIGRNRE
jgi:hypothetical protein